MISQSTIEAVRAQVSVREIIKEFADIRKAGSDDVCCCPLHQEKTPSLHIRESRGYWHCFGCGESGDAIAFIRKKMGYNFPDAVRYLAEKYHIKVEEDKQERTPEEQENDKKREAMFAAYEVIQKHFVSNLYAANDESILALNYAKERWGDEFVSSCGIGYAVTSSEDFLKFVKLSALSVDVLLEMGVLGRKDGKDPYAFFRGRLMIPIRDNYARIIGYTARALSDKEHAKYLNTKNNLLYQKSYSIFGIDVAASTGAKEDKFYLVEGAPDVLRLQSIEVLNAVASLGSDWTDQQLKALKRYSRNLCFIPDYDPPKVGEEYGTGIHKVMKSGKQALKLGFRVYVRELPPGEKGTKQDPDSFCKNPALWGKLTEEDFIIWYAKKRENEDGEVTIDTIDEIADLVALHDEAHEQNRYIDQLNKIIQGRGTWSKAIKKARQRMVEEQLRKQGQSNQELLENYGFQQLGNHYASMGSDNKMVEWSNFVLHPLFHIRDAQSAVRIFEIVNDAGRHEVIELKQEDLTSLQKFCQRIEGLGNYLWKASSARLMQLKAYLYEKTETATRIDQLGWQSAGFFAFGNGIHYQGTWYPVDKYGIVPLPDHGNQFIPAFSCFKRAEDYKYQRSFVHSNLNGITLKEYVSRVIDVFGDNGKVAFAFLLATLFRDVIVTRTTNFPILNIFGPKGSGKSTFASFFTTFFIADYKAPNLMTATLASLAESVAECSNALVHLDEFKNYIDGEKRELLKGLWDGVGRTRMSMDKDQKREISDVKCGVIVTGQDMATADVALFSRFIFLNYANTEFSTDAKKRIDKLMEVRNLGCTHLTLEILSHRPQFEHRFRQAFINAFDDLNGALPPTGIEDRIFRNWVVPLAAFAVMQPLLDLPYTYADLLRICTEGVIYQNKLIKKTNEIAVFWSIISFLSDDGTLVQDGDYMVEYETGLDTKDKGEYVFSQPKRVLYIKQTRALTLYTMYGHQIAETLLPQSSLEYYLMNSTPYLGKKVKRYDTTENGEVVTTTTEHADGSKGKAKVSKTTQSFCFDYDKLVEQYELNLIDDDQSHV